MMEVVIIQVMLYMNMIVVITCGTIGDDVDGENINDKSGYSVSINDDSVLAVGAINNQADGVTDAGACSCKLAVIT